MAEDNTIISMVEDNYEELQTAKLAATDLIQKIRGEIANRKAQQEKAYRDQIEQAQIQEQEDLRRQE